MPRRAQRQRERSDSDSDPNPQPARRVKFRNEAQVQETSSPRSSPPPLNPRSQAREDEAEKNDPKVLAFYAPYANQFSAAYYEPEERKIHVLEDTKDTWGWDLATLLLEQIQPDVVIMSSKSPEPLIEKVTAWCEEQGQDPEEVLSIQPSKVFQRSHAMWSITTLKLPDVNAFRHWLTDRPDPSSDDTAAGTDDTSGTGTGVRKDDDAGMGRMRMAMVKMGCKVNLDAPNTVCVTGALIYYTQGHITGGNKQGLELTGIQTMSLDQHMLINQDALTSLAILDTESHALMHNQAQKQSLTLFGLLNTCVTPLGKKLLHTWHLRPLTDIGAIAARHDAIDMLVFPANQFPVEHMRRAMKQIGNVGGLCMKIRKNRGTWRDWKRIMEALLATLEVREKLNEIGHETHLPIVNKVDKHINDDIQLFLTFISQIIDCDSSAADDRICVRAGIDEELDQWREDYASLDSVLLKITLAVLQPTVVKYRMGDDVNAVYFPQLGHLAVLTNRNMSIEIPAHLEWELRFTTGDQQYFKTPEMKNMDDHFGDIHTKIIDKEIEYADRMAEAVKQVEGTIDGAVEAVAELDCLLALAAASRNYHLVKPIMTDRPVLEINEGRHLIQEQLVNTYVTNDTLLQGGYQDDGDSGLNSMMIVTGANGSGKSAYGKQVALIAFMAQIGSFVPATNATIGIVDKIYTRVQTRESASKPASAFMIDLAQVSLALRGATSQSLIILDEFGKGTTSADGAGLLAGVIDFLIHDVRPRTIILTHFHELFANSLISDDLPIVQAHMKTITPMSNDSRVTFLYKLSPTVCLTSMAAECAEHYGIPKDIVDRARFVTDCVSKFELHKIYDTQLTPEQADELAMAEAAVRAFVSWDISWESVDVAMQVRDMLERCELEVKEMLEADKEGEGEGEGGGGEEDEVEEEGVVEDEVGGGIAEVVESDEEERSSEVARGGVVELRNGSGEEDDDSD